MKTLILLRHGKSNWDEPLPDHDRPLTKRGKRDAATVGRLLTQEGLAPEWVWSSTAARARDTADRAARAGEWDVDVAVTEALYGADATEILAVLSGTPDWADSVLAVGHNPGMEDAASELARDLVSLRTCELAVIRLPVESWVELRGNPRGRLEALMRGADGAAGAGDGGA
jgi:phosphohistidine phosphatase